MGPKSRQTWTHLGDKNNRYFQTLTLNRRRKKNWKIRDVEGLWFDDQNRISKVFIKEFTKRFTLESLRINLDLFDSFSPCITNEKNKELIKVVTEEEIYSAQQSQRDRARWSSG